MTYLHSLLALRGGGARPEPTGNAVTTARLSMALGDKWRAYDGLPPQIRQALAQANVDLCPHSIRDAFGRVLSAARPLGLEEMAVELYLEEFLNAQLGEIEQFSARQYLDHGRHSPHVDARASMLTEDTRPVRRHNRRPR